MEDLKAKSDKLDLLIQRKTLEEKNQITTESEEKYKEETF